MNVTSIDVSSDRDIIDSELSILFTCLVFAYLIICCCCISFYHWYQRSRRLIRVDVNQPIVITYPQPIYREKSLDVIIEPMPHAP